VGLCTDPGDGTGADRECAAAAEQVGALLEAAGHHVVEVTNPINEQDRATLARCLLDVMSVGAATAVASLPTDRQDLLQDYTRWLAERGRRIDGVHLHTSQSTLAGVAIRALTAQAELDLLVTPTVTRPQIGVTEFDLDQGDASYAAMLDWAAFTPMANCTGQPAVSIPAATTSSGLPVGVQLQGRIGSDLMLLDIAEALELTAAWAERVPPMLQHAETGAPA
jgi:Asp-tRNA(Asn)/Glu-tRNA(Gln) amidotransferase A subunit family amidase